MCGASENLLLIEGNLSDGTTTKEIDESKKKYLVFFYQYERKKLGEIRKH